MTDVMAEGDWREDPPKPKAPTPLRAVARKPHGFEYPEATRDRAFHVWALEGNRSPRRTARILEEELRSRAIALGDDPDAVEIPHEDSIGYWARTENWTDRAYAMLYEQGTFQAISAQERAFALVQLRLANNKLSNLIAAIPDDDPSYIGQLTKAAEFQAKLTGNFLGVPFTGAPPPLPPPPDDGREEAIDFAAMTPEERAAKRAELANRSLTRIRATRAPKKGKRR